MKNHVATDVETDDFTEQQGSPAPTIQGGQPPIPILAELMVCLLDKLITEHPEVAIMQFGVGIGSRKIDRYFGRRKW